MSEGRPQTNESNKLETISSTGYVSIHQKTKEETKKRNTQTLNFDQGFRAHWKRMRKIHNRPPVPNHNTTPKTRICWPRALPVQHGSVCVRLVSIAAQKKDVAIWASTTARDKIFVKRFVGHGEAESEAGEEASELYGFVANSETTSNRFVTHHVRHNLRHSMYVPADGKVEEIIFFHPCSSCSFWGWRHHRWEWHDWIDWIIALKAGRGKAKEA